MIQKIIDAVEKNKELVQKAHKYIWSNPETGYREWKTTEYLKKEYEKLGYNLNMAGDIPGFYTEIDTGKEGPKVMILGELDSLICPNHPDSDPETGAVHCCGHSAQSAALLGIAAALKEPGIMDDMCGKIVLCAVPAEELIEVEYRTELKNKGVIKYFGGKAEFLRRGYFDDVDIAFMVHTSIEPSANLGSIGCMAKKISYKGVSAHAGGSPWRGVNALYAANLGLSAINSIRETFKDNEHIRVHPIITHGGEVVNAIPELVTMESFVRGLTFEAIADANNKVNRALCGAALSLGAHIEIDDTPGYSPLINDENMLDIAQEMSKYAYPDMEFKRKQIYSTGSTDMGDLSGIMPVVHPYAPGGKGTSHGDNYQIESVQLACVDCAKWQMLMLWKLLTNGAECAKKVIAEFTPRFASKEEFLAYIDSIESHGERITYLDDGTAKIEF